MKRCFVILAILFTLPAVAANSSSSRFRGSKRSTATSGIAAPQVVRIGDALLGVRGAIGSSFEGSAILGANFEYIFHRNIGAGLQVSHSGYSTSFGNEFLTGEFSYNIWVVNAYGAFHADVLKVRNLDTYLTAGLGRTFMSSSVSTVPNPKIPDFAFNNSLPATAETSAFFLTASVNGRYFFTPNWSGVASLGLGLGNVGLGMDYLF